MCRANKIKKFKAYLFYLLFIIINQLRYEHTFIPLAFETLGAWGKQAQQFVAELGRRITVVTGDKRETEFLHQRLSVAIQRGNAIACLGTFGER